MTTYQKYVSSDFSTNCGLHTFFTPVKKITNLNHVCSGKTEFIDHPGDLLSTNKAILILSSQVYICGGSLLAIVGLMSLADTTLSLRITYINLTESTGQRKQITHTMTGIMTLLIWAKQTLYK